MAIAKLEPPPKYDMGDEIVTSLITGIPVIKYGFAGDLVFAKARSWRGNSPPFWSKSSAAEPKRTPTRSRRPAH